MATVPGASDQARLWSTDGAPGGTAVVDPDLNLYGSGLPLPCAVVGSRLVFPLDTPAAGRGLWISDGTVSGAGLLANLDPRAASSDPRDLAGFGGAVYFFADQAGLGTGLFRTDGTAAGTERIIDSALGLPNGSGFAPTAGRDRLYYIIDTTGTFGFVDGAVVSDGTVLGTQLLGDFESAVKGIELGDRQSVGDWGIFDDVQAPGSGATDGTLGGTYFVEAPGSPFFAPDLASTVLASGEGDGLFSTAYDEAGATEAWWWRGPGSSAERLIDLAPGFKSSNPRLLGELNGALLLGASTTALGSELYRIELSELAPYGAEPHGSSCGLDLAAKIGFSGSVTSGQTIELIVRGALPLEPALAYYDAGTAVLPLGWGCAIYVTAPKLLGTVSIDAEGAVAARAGAARRSEPGRTGRDGPVAAFRAGRPAGWSARPERCP